MKNILRVIHYFILLNIIFSISLHAGNVYIKSVKECMDDVDKNPESIGAWSDLGLAYFSESKNLKGDNEREYLNFAMQAYSKVVELNQLNADAHIKLSEIYYNLDMVDNAYEEAIIAVGLNPDNGYYNGRIALVYYKKENYKKAVIYFQKAAELSGKKGFYYNMAGNCFEKMGKYKESGDCYLKYIEDKPWDDLIYARVSKLYYKAGEIELGDKYKKMAGNAWKDYSDTGNDGWSYYRTGDYNKALEIFDLKIKENPSDPEGYWAIGIISKKTGDMKKALALFKKSVSVDSNFVKGYSSIADCYVRKDNLKDSIRLYKKALKLDTSNYYSMKGIGNVYLKQGDILNARQYLIKAYSMKSDDIYLINNLADLYMQSDEYNNAMLLYEKAYELNKSEYCINNYARSLFKYAEQLIKIGEPDKALEYYKKVLTLSPGNKYAGISWEQIKKISKEK